jgi:hypothetical protein
VSDFILDAVFKIVMTAFIPKDQKAFELAVSKLETAFDQMKWVPNRNRKNVTDEKSCLSMAFGTIFRPGEGCKDGVNNTRFPDVYKLLCEMRDALGFECKSFTVNKNLKCKLHRDRDNNGDSVIFSLGKFTGGELFVDGHKYDIFHKPIKFNGSKLLHETADFKGTRYSIVLYSISDYRSPKHLRKT